MEKSFISPVGYIDLDNDCEYSIDLKSTRSRESVLPKEDLAFYFNTYIEPKYGLGNINVSNCASFMKDLELNWHKLDNNLKIKVMDIMVDYIFAKPGDNFDFKNRFMAKMKSGETVLPSKSTFTETSIPKVDNSLKIIGTTVIVLGIVLFLLDKIKYKPSYTKMF
jgi:hypothetical protein